MDPKERNSEESEGRNEETTFFEEQRRKKEVVCEKGRGSFITLINNLHQIRGGLMRAIGVNYVISAGSGVQVAMLHGQCLNSGWIGTNGLRRHQTAELRCLTACQAEAIQILIWSWQ